MSRINKGCIWANDLRNDLFDKTCVIDSRTEDNVNMFSLKRNLASYMYIYTVNERILGTYLGSREVHFTLEEWYRMLQDTQDGGRLRTLNLRMVKGKNKDTRLV